jgi:hypothetical protein
MTRKHALRASCAVPKPKPHGKVKPHGKAKRLDQPNWRDELEALLPTAPTATAPTLGFTIRRLQEASGVGRNKIYLDLAAGRLQARKHGKRTIILADEARRWLESLPVAQFSHQQTTTGVRAT